MGRQNKNHTHTAVHYPLPPQKGPKSIINNLLSINYSVGNGLGVLLVKVTVGAGIP